MKRFLPILILLSACAPEPPRPPAPPSQSIPEDGSLTALFADAAARLRAGETVRLQLPPGEFREFPGEVLALAKDPGRAGEATLILEGDPGHGTLLSGAFPAAEFDRSTWDTVEGQPDLLTRPWPHAWTPHAGPWMDHRVGFRAEAARREQIFLNGIPLRLRLLERHRYDPDRKHMVFDGMTGFTPEQLAPGEFTLVSDPAAPAHLRGRIWMRLPENAGVSPRIDLPRFTGRIWRPLLEISGVGRVEIRNLHVRHANAGPSTAAVALTDVRELLMEDCRFDDNVNVGLNLARISSGSLRRVHASRNGKAGMVIGESRNLELTDCVTNDNNFRGAWEHFIHWHPAGIKFGNSHSVRMLRHTAVGNHATGIWTDVWCTEIDIDQSLAFGNRRLGIMLELSKTELGGGYRVNNSLVARNAAGGVFFSNAIDCQVDNSLLAYNGGLEHIENAAAAAQIVVKGHDRPGTVLVRDMHPWTVRNSELVAGPGQYIFGTVYTRTTPEDMALLAEGIRFDANTFRLSDLIRLVQPQRPPPPGLTDTSDFDFTLPPEPELYLDWLQRHSLPERAEADILAWLEQSRLAGTGTPPPRPADPDLIE